RHHLFLALDGPPRRGGQHGAHEAHVRLIEAGTPLPLEPFRARHVVAEPRIPAEREGVGAEETTGEVVLHVAAHPFPDRHDGDQEHHADHHAQQREKALELLDADLGEREAHCLEDGHYSYRNASTGSSFDARIAGSMPKITPVIALAPRAATMASGGT